MPFVSPVFPQCSYITDCLSVSPITGSMSKSRMNSSLENQTIDINVAHVMYKSSATAEIARGGGRYAI